MVDLVSSVAYIQDKARFHMTRQQKFDCCQLSLVDSFVLGTGKTVEAWQASSIQLF